MPKFQTRRQVSHSAKKMFELVADVEQYPQFLPLCESLTIRSREQHQDKTILVAEMEVGYQMVRERFTSQVTLLPEELKILVEYLDGPFHYLENRWQFLPRGENHSEIDFFISYEFRSLPLQMLMGAMFDRAFRKFSQAFIDRANYIYV